VKASEVGWSSVMSDHSTSTHGSQASLTLMPTLQLALEWNRKKKKKKEKDGTMIMMIDIP
jgi:hypothetical protein